MPTTGQEIIEAGYGKSTKNRPATIATDGVELLGVLNRAIAKYFSKLARANPVLIADAATVTFNVGWTRPAAAASIMRIETTTGSEVKVVPFNDRLAEATLPSVYRLARTFYSAGNANDPTSGDLVFIYAKFPTMLGSLAAQIDAAWPEFFNECLNLEIALYLANKDGRNDELAGLEAERDEWTKLLLEYAEHETANESRRFDLLNKFQTQARRPQETG